MDTTALLTTLVMGAGATAAIDLWNAVLFRAFGVRSLDYCVLGRWVRGLARGRFVHRGLPTAPALPGECPIGWLAHYGIGLTLAVAFVGLATPQWLASPTLGPALAFGLATVVFPFFVMQPAFGLGIAASRTPNPAAARLKSLGTHAVFGLALYGLALAARVFAR